MNIAIIGYGRMGQTIESIALDRRHEIKAIIDVDNKEDIHHLHRKNIHAAIEFTQPESAYKNITALLQQNIPVVSGTTGWLDKMEEIKKLVVETDTGFFYAPNYSIGVNLFFAINEFAARLMNKFPDFGVHIEEVHHIHKLDSPSGTAIHMANDILKATDRMDSWVNHDKPDKGQLGIHSARKPDVPGIHSTMYTGDFDEIEIKHTATSRHGFATGAVLAAEYISDKKGIHSMKDLLEI